MLAFIFALILVTTAKNEYHFFKLKKPRNFIIAFISTWLLSYPFWYVMLIGYFLLRHSGALGQIKANNIKKEQEEKFREQMQQRMAQGQPPYGPAGNQYGTPINGQYNAPYNNPQPQGRPVQQNVFTQATYNRRFDSSLSYNLPKSQRQREKIIKKFNNTYNLGLDSGDIKTIASASYFSVEWASEIAAMNQKYNSIYEWMGTGRSWLRIYISVFSLVDVFSAFSKQESYVYDTFDRIFSDICVDESLPVEVVVENINAKYLTNFDEISFMQAIAYMEACGRKYKFGAPLLNNVNYEMERLQNKYDGTPSV